MEGFINFVYFAQCTGEKNVVFFSNENRFAKDKTKFYKKCRSIRHSAGIALEPVFGLRVPRTGSGGVRQVEHEERGT